ncbi:MAG: DUF3795 domain-containing protein [Candidatus Thorarchaeota archaeon]
MTLDEIIEILAPCGLDCKKCVAYTNGDIQKTSKELQNLLGNFEEYAQKYSKFYPAFQDYAAFERMLQYLAKPRCDGCRKGHCLYEGCGVATCEKIKSGQFAFCFECEEFPCERPQFPPDLKRRWTERNTRMAEIGVEAYYQESRDKPRYV